MPESSRTGPPRSPSTPAHTPLGALPTGEAYYAPLGEMRSDGDRVQCHLCGRWFKMVGGWHLLAAHGWTTAEYRDAFHLNATASTVAPATAERKRERMLEQIERGERSYPLPVKGGPPTSPAWRSLAALRPDALADWHPTRNRALEQAGIAPRTIGVRSNRNVWWRCQCCGHDWESSVRARDQGAGCPVCYRRTLHERSLGVLRPELLAEWHPERNEALDPYLIGVCSTRKVWWRCAQCRQEWRAVIKHRTLRGQGCPECGKRKAAEFAATCQRWRVPTERSFAVLRPDLLAEWHPKRNQALDPYAIGPGSSMNVWWRCRRCGYEWQTRTGHRCEGAGCPSCSGRHVVRERSLGALRPELLDEWHPARNAGLDPYTIAPRTLRVKIWWRCRYCGHEWQTSPAGRGGSKGGCRKCAAQHNRITKRDPGG